MASQVRQDFEDGKIKNLHPSYINERKRKYHSDQVGIVADEFWTKDATMPEPAYRKVRFPGCRGFKTPGGCDQTLAIVNRKKHP